MTPRAAVRRDRAAMLLAGLSVFLAASLIAAAEPPIAVRLLPLLAGLPLVAVLAVPCLRVLGRRIGAGWVGESLGFIFASVAIERAMAGLFAVTLTAGVALASTLLAVRDPETGAASSTWTPLGVSAALAALTILVASLRPTELRWARLWPAVLACVGTGLIAGATLEAGYVRMLGLAGILLPAQTLPVLMAVLWLPWLERSALVTGGAASLVVAIPLSLMIDPGTAALAGLLVNLVLAALLSIAFPPPDLDMRARLQQGLPTIWPSRHRPAIVAAVTAWAFLALGPGWSVLSEATGGDLAVALQLAGVAVALSFWLSAQKRTSQSMRPNGVVGSA